MTAHDDFDIGEFYLPPLDTLEVDKKGMEDVLKTVKSLSTKVERRVAKDVKDKQQQQRETAALVAEAEADTAAAAAAADDYEDTAQHEQKIQDNMQKVQDTLQEDEAAVQPEPDVFDIVVKGVQELPALQVDHLPLLQQHLQKQRQLLGTGSMCSSHIQGTSSSPPSSSSSSPAAAAAAAFLWLLQGSDQLAVCPDEAWAAAAFQAVCCGCPALAAAAYRRLLGWCGASEVQTGVGCVSWTCEGAMVDLDLAAEVQEQQQSRQHDKNCSSSSSSSMSWLVNQQTAATVAWLPKDADFLEAFASLGCMRESSSSSSSKGGSRKQQPAAAAALEAELLPLPSDNLNLLLQLITQLCRLGAGGKLAIQLGSGGHGQQLALLLLRLQLDPRVATACKCSADQAFAAFIEAAGATDWSRLVPVLLEALSGGLGPSHRSSILLLSQLPLTERGGMLRQQGALLLLQKLLPGQKSPQPPQALRCTTKPDPRQLVVLLSDSKEATAAAQGSKLEAEQLTRAAVRKMLRGLVAPSSSSGGGGKADADGHDYWRLLNIVDAAHLLLWMEVVKPGSAGLDSKVRSWFVKWMEKLEHELVKKLQSHRVRSRLTELINMYTFAEHLVHCQQARAAAATAAGGGAASIKVVTIQDDEDDLE